MFGYRYVKASPSTYVLQYKNGKPVREGTGLTFWYFAPSTTLVSIPLESVDVPFMFREVSSDFQEVTVQGQVAYRVTAPKTLAGLMNFTLKPDGSHASEDPGKLPQRVVNTVQVQLRSVLQGQSLEELLRNSDHLVQVVRNGLQQEDGLAVLGLELVNLSILAIKPNPETARALEAQVREQILKQADDATYLRRNAAIEQERSVKENELNTEIAVEAKKRQIREAQLEAERSVLAKRQAIQDEEMAGRIALEEKNKRLTALRATNAQTEADAKAYGVAATMKAVQGVDAKVLQALMVGQADPSALIAQAFQGLAENASRIGELNISPELLQQLTKDRSRPAKA
ncbi:SPFH domain-containing protein [Pseudoxanthomonas sp.]|uniref:SPFH domain-containing protein n=1 Tax=Pseudoxanthomonas sp. TaxID=1871049 RepID=UPI002605B680|nr:SPFH domain-containing protein [Pseudoxanthomonas sp.]WDS37919.1 MAG: SPFH domain-containing protein [Pseudoxanthomonas sp.]